MIAQKYDKHDMMQSEFEERARRILPHGLGLSVDVYQPVLIDLMRALREADLAPAFLEVFKASTSALRSVRSRFPDVPLAYHGEGLWVTQPDFLDSPSGRLGVSEACTHLMVLRSAWLNHECATKQMGGYSFGTYLPPLYTESAARMTSDNLRVLQSRLDQAADAEHAAPPLLLLEMPPLTYFGCGTMPIPDFFRVVTERAACGLVLDIGHLWTVYRYTGAWREQSLQSFADMFMRTFPMERVIEIHVAGLAPHSEDTCHRNDYEPPRWIDAHGAAIPEALFDLLRLVLRNSRLSSLKGIALEVDTKPIPDVVSEFRRFTTEFAGEKLRWTSAGAESATQSARRSGVSQRVAPEPVGNDERRMLGALYRRYAEFVQAGGHDAQDVSLAVLGGGEDEDSVRPYRQTYLPYEVIHWGGDVADMFPETCARLCEAGIDLRDFVAFWFGAPRIQNDLYDFFLLKIERFMEFVAHRTPSLSATARSEADELRRDYHLANEALPVQEARA
jgi:uncharacterized protein (UPF0276 family)